MLSEKIGRIQSPKIIRIGGGVAKEIADVLKQLNLSRPLIVTDKNLVELGHVDLVLEILKNYNKIGRAHVRTPVTSLSRMPSSA